MKLTLGLLLSLIVQGWAINSYSQKAIVNLDLKNVDIIKVLDEIEKQTDYYFLFNYEQIHSDKKIDVKLSNSKIDEVLNKILEGTGLNYSVKNRQIVISKEGLDGLKEQLSSSSAQQQKSVSGKVTDSSGATLPGVSVVVKGTTTGVITDMDGKFSLPKVPDNAILQFSFVGMKTQEIIVEGKTTINVTLTEETIGIEEVVAVGYGTQKKSDITGTVSSLNQDKLKKIVVSNVAQLLQGAVSGVVINQNSGGAEASNQSIMIRGRNSITANTSPLIVVDGVSFSGNLTDINPNDIKSLEILKDASSAAIYGSRGSNGVILITTKGGEDGKTTISYDGYYSVQNFTNVPDLMDGEQFYQMKMLYAPTAITPSELEVYNKKEWVNYYDLSLRQGSSQNHNLSASGGTKHINYFISVNLVNTEGLAINDNYKRLSNRVNVEGKVTNWLTLGTRNTFAQVDRSGASPSFGQAFWMNPLTKPYNDDGTIAIYPWPEDHNYNGPLTSSLFDDSDLSYQITTNNYLNLNVPFIKGLQYRLNTGYVYNATNHYQYRGRNTVAGIGVQGSMLGDNNKSTKLSVENIITYDREFDKHHLFLTGLYSFDESLNQGSEIDANGFPNDVLTYYGLAQASFVFPRLTYQKSNLISQMLRANYAFDSRYLLTLTVRRDGYSGFGSLKKFGTFPSMAIGWNISNEGFFGNLKGTINSLKLRASFGKNGNQAISPYSTISRLDSRDYVAGINNAAGYFPSSLGQDDLGWESTTSSNFGLDFGVLSNRITGDINIYNSNTSDLLLARAISPVSGFSSIVQNIGKTNNKGIEISINTKNIEVSDFIWRTEGNISFVKNKIVALYGYKDANGKLTDDIGNRWFIGKPIRVNYDFEFEGVWQLDEAELAKKYGYKPGYAKLADINKDSIITATDDKKIIGQRDPKFTWGLTNTFSYKDISLSAFFYGVHGTTKHNLLRNDNLGRDVRTNDVVKDWWTPTNPSNTMPAPIYESTRVPFPYRIYEDASFVRLKEITLSYDIPERLLDKIKMKRLRVYFTGRNLATFTKFGGIDPELSGGEYNAMSAFISDTPLQKEFIFGINLGL